MMSDALSGKQIKDEVERLVKAGSSLSQAVSAVCRKNRLNPYLITRKYFQGRDVGGEGKYKDIKTDVGTFVTIRGDETNAHYEVININNKDAIVLRNVDNNQEVVASEEEITPVITESRMDKLNEALYTVSIDGLQTTDGTTLSQLLSTAAEADMAAPEEVATPVDTNPEPFDTTTGSPIDIPTGDETVTDTLPDESIETVTDTTVPTDLNVSDYETVDTTDIPTDLDTVDGTVGDTVDDTVDTVDTVDTTVPEIGDETVTTIEDETVPEMGDETIGDMTIDQMNDEGFYENFDYDALIKESLKAAGITESEEVIPAEDDGSEDGEQTEFAEEITESEDVCPKCGKKKCKCGKDCKCEDGECVCECGDTLEEARVEEGELLNEGLLDYIFEPTMGISYAQDFAKDYDLKALSDALSSKDNQKIQDELLNYARVVAEDEGLDINRIEQRIKDTDYVSADSGSSISEEDDIEDDLDDEDVDLEDDSEEDKELLDEEDTEELTDFDAEIAEALRNAGVQLDEGEATLPTPVDQETLYANKEAENNEGLAPEYHEVDTTPFSKEASEGFKLTLESAVNVNKIKSLYETAKSMYAKKDSKEWLSLDRRYITKFINEGVGYEKANKLLIAAKKGL